MFLHNLTFSAKHPAPASLCRILLLLACFGAGRLSAAPDLPVIHSVAQIRALSREEANRSYPVHLTAVVTFAYAANITDKTIPPPLLANLFIQDSTGGNWVKLDQPAPDLHAGDKIELTGHTVQTDFAPDIAGPHWRHLGSSPFPSPLRAEFGQLASTQSDSLWVELNGIVRSAQMVGPHLQLTIRMNGGDVQAYIPELQVPIPPGLLYARIRALGVCGSEFNSKNQLRGVYLFVPTLDQIKILEPGLSDPFSAPERTVGGTLRFTVGGATSHLVRMRGIVTLQRPGRFLFLNGPDGRIRANSDEKLLIQPGQTVEIVGFPALGEFGPILEQARYRVVGPRVSLHPATLSPTQLLDDDRTAELIQMNAVLLERIVSPLEQILIARVGQTIVQARLEDPESLSFLSSLDPGSALRLTGIAEGISKNNTFLLLLRTHHDVLVLSRPSWWNVRHTIWVFGIMAILIAASLAWLTILRRKIRAQTLLIQQRLESETALEHRYRQLFERNLAGVFTMDDHGRILDCNEACVHIFGCSDKQELLAAGSRAAVSLHAALAGKLSSGETNKSSELELSRADGRESWLLLNSTLIESDAGPLTEGTIIDITELKHTVRKLEERTTFLNTLVSSNPLGIAITGADRKIVTCNRSFEQMFLYTENEVIGCRLTDILGIDQAKFHESLARLANGQPISSVTRRTRKDGVGLDVEAHGVPIIIDGKVVGICAIYQDISERVAAEAELRATKEAAEMASRAKSEFLANMSHEIRTPMNGILLAAELAAAINLTPEQQDYLETIRTSGNSLLLLLNDILDLSKIEAGKMEMHSAEFSIHDCLSDCLTLMGSRARQKNLDLTLRVDPLLPDRVDGDSLRLRQIVLNLLGNALKFTQQGSIAVDVALLQSREGQIQCRFSVSDTGIGIPPEKCSSIFREFEQADSSTTRRFGGTGLGLAISSKLVGLMGGVIDLQSQVGQGSTFSFTACFAIAHSTALPNPSVSQRQPNGTPQSLRVLLAEDNAINRKLAIRLLERAGHLVVAAENGRQVVRLYQEQPFDVVLMDVHMPEMDGIEATRQIRALQSNHGTHVPIIAVTASAMKEDREACLSAGMDSYISKPICTDELMAVLASVAASQAA